MDAKRKLSKQQRQPQEEGEEQPLHWQSMFTTVAGYRGFVPFGSLNATQEECVAALKQKLPEILRVESRERHLLELQQCIAGYTVEDRDEPISSSSFSQYAFYLTYTRLQFHRDLFDFLLNCILHKVCTIATAHSSRFKDLLGKILILPDALSVPEWAVRAPLDPVQDEEDRVEAFVLRKQWVQDRDRRLADSTTWESTFGPPIQCCKPPPPAIRAPDPLAQFITDAPS
eukprot:RCo013075